MHAAADAARGGRFVLLCRKIARFSPPCKNIGAAAILFRCSPLSGMDKPGLREAGLYAYAFSARDFLYFSLSQLAMKRFAASPIVDTV